MNIIRILAILSALLAIDLTEEDKLLATPLTNAGLPYAGYGYGCAGLSYSAAAPAKVEVKTVEASAVNFAAAHTIMISGSYKNRQSLE